ncbi:MAG: S1 RNA-binding domain-containing protein [Anaerolineae bacterium]
MEQEPWDMVTEEATALPAEPLAEIAAPSPRPAGAPLSIADLEPGMQVTGRVKSVTDFGAFVDLGVGPQGLVHISQLARRRVSKVTDVVQVGDEVQVWIKKVDKKRGRISLTMIRPVTLHLKDIQPDVIVQGVVTRIEPYGVFVDIGAEREGLIHISELVDGFVNSPEEVVSIGDRIEARVLQVDRKSRKVHLSTKEFFKIAPPPPPEPAAKEEIEEAKPPTTMELAFQASLQRNNSALQVRGLNRLIARRLKH